MPFHRAIPQSKPPAKSSGGLATYVQAEKLLHLAFVLPASVAIWGLVGWEADKHLHQQWMMIAGVIFGSVAGLAYMIRMALDTEKNSRKQDSTQNGTGEGGSETPS
jgi:F0F1-type ATP synthase assembly protein I